MDSYYFESYSKNEKYANYRPSKGFIVLEIPFLGFDYEELCSGDVCSIFNLVEGVQWRDVSWGVSKLYNSLRQNENYSNFKAHLFYIQNYYIFDFFLLVEFFAGVAINRNDWDLLYFSDSPCSSVIVEIREKTLKKIFKFVIDNEKCQIRLKKLNSIYELLEKGDFDKDRIFGDSIGEENFADFIEETFISLITKEEYENLSFSIGHEDKAVVSTMAGCKTKETQQLLKQLHKALTFFDARGDCYISLTKFLKKDFEYHINEYNIRPEIFSQRYGFFVKDPPEYDPGNRENNRNLFAKIFKDISLKKSKHSVEKLIGVIVLDHESIPPGTILPVDNMGCPIERDYEEYPLHITDIHFWDTTPDYRGSFWLGQW